LISTTVRKDGSVQLTYNGWPLYYYFKDAAPGDLTGQAVGNVWWVVSGEGNPIKPAALAITDTQTLGKIHRGRCRVGHCMHLQRTRKMRRLATINVSKPGRRCCRPILPNWATGWTRICLHNHPQRWDDLRFDV